MIFSCLVLKKYLSSRFTLKFLIFRIKVTTNYISSVILLNVSEQLGFKTI